MSCFTSTAFVTATEETGEERREEMSGDIAATATIVMVHKKIVAIMGETPFPALADLLCRGEKDL
ncbi:MAG: hypothetical protein QHG94_07455 [Candidatus Methanosuratincola sp.]|nr:hypothetical protein [Candidatus Methanosuratincola sp.]